MRESHIKCPVEKKTILKSIYCPDKECSLCLALQDKKNQPKERTQQRPKRPYTEPKEFYFKCPITDVNYDILCSLDEKIKQLKKEQDKGKKDLLAFKELLFDLGRKGFNLNKYYSLANRDFDQLLYFRKSWKKESERLRKAKKDYERILKILENHEKAMRQGWCGNRDFKLGVLVKEKIKEWLLSEETLKSLYEYLTNRGVKPGKESAERWELFDGIIEFAIKDLTEIGHSKNEAYKLTATLLQKIGLVDYTTYEIITKGDLKKPYPIQFKNFTHHAVRERHNYLQKKKK